MNCLNNLSKKCKAGAGARTEVGIKAGTRAGPKVELQDGTREVPPK